MEDFLDLRNAYDKILQIKILLLELKTDAEQFPALSKNAKRALASVKMMELNCSDLVEFNLKN